MPSQGVVYQVVRDHDLCRAVVGVSVRTVLGFLRHVAHVAGVVDGRGGAIAIVQRFGGALNLNVHVHALVIDGVFARDGADVRFCPAPGLTAADVADVLATIVPRVRRLLEWRGLGDGEEGASAADEWAEGARPCEAVPVEDQFREDKVPGAGTPAVSLVEPRARRGSTSMPACGSRPTSGTGSSGSAGTRCGQPSRRTGFV